MKRLIPILLLLVSGVAYAEPIILSCTFDNPKVSLEIKTMRDGPIEVYPLEIDLDANRVKWTEDVYHDLLYVDDQVIHWQKYSKLETGVIVAYYFTRKTGILISVVLGPFSYYPKEILSDSYFRCFEPF